VIHTVPAHSSDRLRELGLVAALALGLLAVLNLPYILALTRTDGQVFGGSIVAVPDGHSYLAKMQLGASGALLYTPRFTTEPGFGVILFTFYMALGHLARMTGIAVPALYQIARLVTGLFFLMTAYHVLRPLADTVAGRLKIWAFFFMASGLGWLVTPLTGALSSDLWVAESIPLLSLLANPHFPFAWALLLWLLYTGLPAWSGPNLAWRSLRVAAIAFILAEVYPMAVPTALVTLGAAGALEGLRRRTWSWQAVGPALAAGFTTAPRLLYTAWIVRAQPQIASWNVQNFSPIDGFPLVLAWAGLLLVLAGIGAGWALRSRAASERDRMWVLWLVVGIAAVYFPYELQRRLSLGVLFPMTPLAMLGWRNVLAPRLGRWAATAPWPGAVVLVLSNVLVWAGALAAATSANPEIFMSTAEARAIAALPVDAVVVAAPELGGFIPTRSDARVVYGHAAETPEAEARRQAVLDFYAGRTPADWLDRFGVNRVFFGPREAALGPQPTLSDEWQLLSDDAGLRVYAREASP